MRFDCGEAAAQVLRARMRSRAVGVRGVRLFADTVHNSEDTHTSGC